MAADYDTVRLGEVASVRSGFAFKSSHWAASGVPVVKIANVKDGNLVMDSCSFVPQHTADAARESLLREGDILIAMTGYIGDVALVRKSNLPAVLNQRVGRFSIRDRNLLDQHFLFFLLRDAQVREEIEGLGYGSAQPNVSPTLIHGVELPLPPLPEQRAIAHILGTLDDKIELNRRMNETLEATARALFKSWFVDFDPVRAKAEGRDPGLPKPLADLFPARLVPSELGEIPEGWEVGPLDSIAHFQNGLALQKYRPTETGGRLPVVKIAQLRSGTADNGEWATAALKPECVIDDGDVVFSWSGSLLVKVWTGGRAALNQHLFKVTSDKHPKWFFLHATLSHLPEFRRIAAGKATTMGHIKRHHLTDARCVIPDDALLSRAEDVFSAVVDRFTTAALESRTLAALRDTLLPKLISGELRVPDAERIVARAEA